MGLRFARPSRTYQKPPSPFLLSFNVPPRYLSRYAALTAYHTVNADHIHIYPTVRDFYARRRREGAFIQVHSGTADPILLSTVAAAKLVNAQQIVLPPYNQNMDETIRSVETATYYKDVEDFSIAVIPQGSSNEEYLECWKRLTDNLRVQTICIPPTVHPMLMQEGHPELLELPYISYHALYVRDPLELLYMRNTGWITRANTYTPFLAAEHYVEIDPVDGWMPKAFDSMKMTAGLDTYQRHIADINHMYALRFASGCETMLM